MRPRPTSPTDAIVDASCDPHLAKLAERYAELTLDTLMAEAANFAKIPVIETIVGVSQAAMAIRDRIFIAKVARFLFCVGPVDEAERERFQREIRENAKVRTKVGQSLILILDRIDSLEKTEVLAWVYRSLIRGQISSSTFLRLASAIDLAFTPDLLSFIGADDSSESSPSERDQNLVRTGLTELRVSVRVEPPRIEASSDTRTRHEYRVTHLGYELQRVVKNRLRD